MVSTYNNVICSKSWTDINIDFGTKTIRHCCKSQSERFDNLTVETINNTSGIKQRRIDSINGIKNAQCNYCWNHNSSIGLSYKDIHSKTIDLTKTQDDLVEFIELKFDNVCNLSCLYCNETDSSTIAKEKGLVSYIQKYNNNDVDVVIDYIKNIIDKKEIVINMLGGEPTLSKGYHKFIETLLKTHSNNKNIILVTTTNGQMSFAVRNKINSYMNKTSWKWVWGFSGESVGSVFEGIRHLSNFDLWIENVKFFIKHQKTTNICFNPTVNNLSIKSLPMYLQTIEDFKCSYILNGNFVLYPDRLSIEHSPLNLKKYIEESYSIISDNCKNKDEVIKWLDILYASIGKKEYNKERMHEFLYTLNTYKNKKINIDFLMEQLT